MDKTDDKKNQSYILTGHACVLASVVIGSFVFIAIKVARRELGPVSLFLLRNNLAAGLVLLLWLFRRPQGICHSWPLLGALAFVAVARGPLYQILLNAGAEGVSVGMIAILIATIPLHVIWLSPLLLREPVRPHQIVAMILAFGGAIVPVVLSFELYFTAPRYPLMIAGSALLGAFVVVFVRKMTLQLSTLDITTLTLFLAAVFCLPLNTPSQVSQWSGLSPATWTAVIFLIVGMLATNLLMYEALRRLPAQIASPYQFASMVLTVIWGRLLMSEAFDWTIVASVVLVTTGLVMNANGDLLSRLRPRQRN
jgi:drug/metabolite transporter (DMT)-like permease